jgi:hypothetical protein
VPGEAEVEDRSKIARKGSRLVDVYPSLAYCDVKAALK